MPAEVAHGGGVTLAHLDQAGRGYPLESLPDRGPRHPEDLGEAAFAGQRLPRLHLTAEHLIENLLENLFGYRASTHGL